MDTVTKDLEVGHDSQDKDECREGQNDDHVAEHCEGLGSRISAEEERHDVCEWNDSEWERCEDPLCRLILLVEDVEERNGCCYSDVELD